MDVTSQEIIKPATDFALLTLYHAKLALNIPQSDTSKDDQLELLIQWASDEISVLCNRVFAKETLTETYLSVGDVTRIYPSHYPVVSVDSIQDDGSTSPYVVDDDYVLNTRTGVLSRRGAVWTGDVVMTYTGGYDLPFRAPPALAQAALMLTKDQYYASLRGDSTVRMIAHKESRVMYFDPNQAQRGGGGGGGQAGSGMVGSSTRRAVVDLLRKFTVFYV